MDEQDEGTPVSGGSGRDSAVREAAAIAPTRVRRPRSAAATWYGHLGRWYDRLAGPFEAPATEAGLALLDARPGERVLEVGPGPGRAIVALARSVGPRGRVVGVDLAPGMCRGAHERAHVAAVADRVSDRRYL